MSIEKEREQLIEAQKRGGLATLGAYIKLSGPGWLQSAITLGGGSLASSLYLGVLAGFTLLWLQPVAMILGIIMLSAIGYVTLSTGERPFQAINSHVNPVLGWSWAIASLLASMVWCLPQYSLATAVLQQNLLPDVLGSGSELGDFNAKLIIAAVILVVTTLVTWAYDSGSLGIRLYELMLKVMVALIVLCFFGVVVRMSMTEAGLDWGAVFAGFVPDFSMFTTPAPEFQKLINALPKATQSHWESVVVAEQRNVFFSAAATAVGINMTFLLPYTLLRRKWSKEFRGLLSFDLSTGMFIPFVLATSCVIIASASQFHPGMWPEDPIAQLQKKAADPSKFSKDEKKAVLDAKLAALKKELGDEFGKLSDQEKKTKAEDVELSEFAMNVALMSGGQKKAIASAQMNKLKQKLGAKFDSLKKKEKEAQAKEIELSVPVQRIAVSLVRKSALDLAKSLDLLTGRFFADVIFGLGVLGMTLSTITILMLISGLVVCEMFNLPTTGWSYRLGTLAATVGVLGPFVWSDYGFYLAIPTSVFGLTLLPIAYLTFFLLMNQRSLLKEEFPTGGRRIVWNLLMFLSAGIATAASAWVIWDNVHWFGVAGIAVLLVLALVFQAKPAKTGGNGNASMDRNELS